MTTHRGGNIDSMVKTRKPVLTVAQLASKLDSLVQAGLGGLEVYLKGCAHPAVGVTRDDNKPIITVTCDYWDTA